MISWGSALQTKGLVWPALCPATKRLMVACRSTREWKTLCFTRRRVISAKKLSTALSQEQDVVAGTTVELVRNTRSLEAIGGCGAGGVLHAGEHVALRIAVPAVARAEADRDVSRRSGIIGRAAAAAAAAAAQYGVDPRVAGQAVDPSAALQDVFSRTPGE